MEPTKEPTKDFDIEMMDRVAMKAALRASRDAIRTFLSASGHDLCQNNRQSLIATLPEAEQAHYKGYMPIVPPVMEFMEGCIKYRKELMEPCWGKDCPCPFSKTDG